MSSLVITPQSNLHAPEAVANGAQSQPAARESRWLRDALASLRASAARLLLAWILPLGVFLLWWASAKYGWVAEQILPAPDFVAQTFGELWRNGDITTNLSISLQRVLYGFAAGTAIGLLLGVAMGLSPVAKDYLYPTFNAFAQVPSLGWLPLLMMLVGIEESLKIILITKAVLAPVAINTYQGINNVPTRLIEVARVYSFTRWQLLRKVVFPAAFPQIWSGVRFGLTKAWLALVAVELLASSEGLGFLLVYGRQLFQLDVVISAVIVVGAVGFTLDKVLALVEARLLRWRRDSF
ncbi:MAG TPA: ABC transporter permease [Rhodocyclaceae bacterium]|nr:ABC transporter permease [Rhodocyclaceae bacterium]